MPDTQQNQDDQFLSLLRTGDERAMALLFDLYYDSLLAAVEPYVGDVIQADDVVHELFWNIWKKRDSLHITRPVYRYLLKSAFNRARNHLRNHARAQDRLEEVLKSPDELLLLEAVQVDRPADSELHVADIHKLVAAAKRRMSSRVRLTYTLSRVRGLSYAEIAEWMGIGIKAVEKNMSAALKILYDVFGPYLKIVITLLSYTVYE